MHTLVHTLLILTPFACLAEFGRLAAVGVFFLSSFYAGLLELANGFLDPFAGSRADAFRLATFIQETNAGSERWTRAAAGAPDFHALFGATPPFRSHR